MLLLRSHQRFNEVAEFDPDEGKLSIRAKENTAEGVGRRISGSYARLSKNTLLLYKLNGELYLKVDAQQPLRITDDITAQIENHDGRKGLLILRDEGSLLLTVWYQPPVIDPPLEQDYVSSFVEEEDFDFGLFVHNVINSSRRRKEIYRNAAMLEVA